MKANVARLMAGGHAAVMIMSNMATTTVFADELDEPVAVEATVEDAQASRIVKEYMDRNGVAYAGDIGDMEVPEADPADHECRNSYGRQIYQLFRSRNTDVPPASVRT